MTRPENPKCSVYYSYGADHFQVMPDETAKLQRIISRCIKKPKSMSVEVGNFAESFSCEVKDKSELDVDGQIAHFKVNRSFYDSLDEGQKTALYMRCAFNYMKNPLFSLLYSVPRMPESAYTSLDLSSKIVACVTGGATLLFTTLWLSEEISSGGGKEAQNVYQALSVISFSLCLTFFAINRGMKFVKKRDDENYIRGVNTASQVWKSEEAINLMVWALKTNICSVDDVKHMLIEGAEIDGDAHWYRTSLPTLERNAEQRSLGGGDLPRRRS